MKRADILTRLGFSVGPYKKKRILILLDIKTEADDPFAIVHHLLSPAEDVRGIIACHFESKYGKSPRLAHLKGTSAEQNYIEGQKILEYMEMEDVPLVRGTQYPLTSDGSLPESEGAELIIREAFQEDEMPLYIACLGALTDLAVALKLEVNDFYAQVPLRMPWPHGETWSIGDNPSVFVLLQSQNRCTWHTRKAPGIADDMSYIDNPNGRDIRVYDTVDCRLGIRSCIHKWAKR